MIRHSTPTDDCMTNDPTGDVDDLFLQAVVMTPEEREEFLARLDEGTRARVARLLAADRSMEKKEFLEQPLATDPEGSKDDTGHGKGYSTYGDAHPSSVPPELHSDPHQVGPYKILQKIGEGGMGAVYMAEQTKPVRRRVALKLIRAGMDLDQVIARFEAERQALAMMNHQNIAKVLDTGVTDAGKPFFAMELVKGIPITDYCDQNQLSTEKRLELFVQVCRAIQHAHDKGVIHRDIKPSNVLVTLYDGKPVAKVIDFGLAKAMHEQIQLTNRTLFTQYGQVVGSLEYMSPEQAAVNALDVDGTTDVYSLGVLLYELLTGTTPLGKERVRTEAFDRILSAIREEEPNMPSTQVTGKAEVLAALAERRGTQPRQLRSKIRGDLDFISLKALQKDRTDRYPAAEDLADDVERYLDGRPIEARPPSLVYKLRKFLGRKRRESLVPLNVAVLLLACVALAGFGIWMTHRYTRNQNLISLKTDFDDQLENLALEPTSLNSVRDTIALIEEIDAEQASQSTARFHHEIQSLYESRLADPALQTQELSKLESLLTQFEIDDRQMMEELQASLEERRANSWVSTIDLTSPFDQWESILDPDFVHVKNQQLVRRPSEKAEPLVAANSILPTNWVRFGIEFGDAWAAKQQFAVGVNPPSDAARIEVRLRPAPQIKGEEPDRTRIEVWRGDKLIQSADVPLESLQTQALKLEATVEGSRFQVRLNGKSAIRFDDLFGQFASNPGQLRFTWPYDVSLRRLSIQTKQRNAGGSPLETANRLFSEGKFLEAEEQFLNISDSSSSQDLAAEAKFKAAVCMFEQKKHRLGDEIMSELTSLREDAFDTAGKWSLLADVYQLHARLGQNSARQMFDNIERVISHSDREQLGDWLPAYIRNEIVDYYATNDAYMYMLGEKLDPQSVWSSVQLLQLLEAEEWDLFNVNSRLAQAYELKGNSDLAQQTFERFLDEIATDQFVRNAAHLRLVRILIQEAQYDEALEQLDSLIFDAAGSLQTDQEYLLVERAAILTQVDRYEEALAELDRYFALQNNDELDEFYATAIQAVIHEMTGNDDASKSAWIAAYDMAVQEDYWGDIRASIVGSRSGKLTREDAKATVRHVAGNIAPFSVVYSYFERGLVPVELQFSVLRDIWTSEYGKQAAHRIILGHSSTDQTLFDQVRLTVFEVMSRCVAGEDFSSKDLDEQHDRLMWEFANIAIADQKAGKISGQALVSLFLCWKGSSFAWKGFEGTRTNLDQVPSDRVVSLMAYALGRHFTNMHQKGNNYSLKAAENFYVKAIDYAKGDNEIIRLAEKHLSKLNDE